MNFGKNFDYSNIRSITDKFKKNLETNYKALESVTNGVNNSSGDNNSTTSLNSISPVDDYINQITDLFSSGVFTGDMVINGNLTVNSINATELEVSSGSMFNNENIFTPVVNQISSIDLITRAGDLKLKNQTLTNVKIMNSTFNNGLIQNSSLINCGIVSKSIINNGSLNVSGATTLASTLSVSGNIYLGPTSGITSLYTHIDISGNSTTTYRNKDIYVRGTISTASTLSISTLSSAIDITKIYVRVDASGAPYNYSIYDDVGNNILFNGVAPYNPIPITGSNMIIVYDTNEPITKFRLFEHFLTLIL